MEIEKISPKATVITTKYVVKEISPIVYISYDLDGDFQVFSNEGAEMENAKVVSLQDIINLDASILLIKDISKGEKFYRESSSSPWQKI